MKQKLEEVDGGSDRSAEEVAHVAIDRRKLSELVKRGDADIAAGRLLSSEEVLARIEGGFAA